MTQFDKPSYCYRKMGQLPCELLPAKPSSRSQA